MKAVPEQAVTEDTCSNADFRETVAAQRSPVVLGLRGRLLILVFLTLLPTFGIVLYTSHSEREAAQEHAKAHALALTQAVLAGQAERIDDARALLSTLAKVPAVGRGTNPCPPLLRRYIRSETQLANIGVIDPAGRLICRTVHPVDGEPDVSSQPYFQRVRARHEFVLADDQMAASDGEPVLLAAYPVLGIREELRYILFAALRLDWLNDIAAKANLPTGSVFTLFDARGRVLTRYPTPDVLRGRGAAVLAALKGLANQDRPWVGRMRIGGQSWLVSLASLGDSAAVGDLHAMVAIPVAAAFADANRTMYGNLSVLASLGLVILLLAWFSGDLLVVRPVRLLAHAARGITAGDLSARTGIAGGPDEIRTLGRVFDDMAAALAQRELETQAQKERITRLNRIYQVLSAINGAIIRIRDRDRLLQEACRIAVELGHFQFAWVALIEPGEGPLRMAAHAGSAREFILRVRVTQDPEEPEGRGLVGETIRSGDHTVSNAVEDDPRLSAWREEFAELGVRSAAAFPLRIQSSVVGALALYADEPDFFDDRELALLDELAADTSLGLEHIDKERQLNYLAYWDPLTNLPNRTLFVDRVSQSLLRAERARTQAVVLAIDIAGFGRINDTKGRAAGDRVLQAVASRLAAAVRDNESLSDLGTQTGRLGSHEFGLVLQEVDDAAIANTVATRISTALERPVVLEGSEIPVDLRMGAAVYPRDGTQPEMLLHRAQFALHSELRNKTGRVAFYSPQQDTAAKARYELEHALRGAIDNQEFFLEYQPRVDARTGQLVGAEALLRWERPGHGRIPPDQFVPVLEQCGLIEHVGSWVAHAAFVQRLAWQGTVSDDFVLSINASSHEFRAPDYVSRLQRLAEETNIRPEWMEIEITETGLIERGNATAEMLAALRSSGFRLSIDDFGTGYSSLSYLRQFPVDTLKIDQSFVRDIDRDEGALSLARAIMGLANALELAVVAEGVETEGQLRLLAQEGCYEIQGYYFSTALPAGALTTLARDRYPFSHQAMRIWATQTG